METSLIIVSWLSLAGHQKVMIYMFGTCKWHTMAMGPLRQATGPHRSGAGVGVGMLRCWGFPYLKRFFGFLVFCSLVYWFVGFLVSWFLGFKVYWFLGFKTSKFQGFNDPILPNVPFMFLIDIDLISKFKILLDGSSRFIGARLSPTFSKPWISNILRFIKNGPGLSLN